MLLVGNGAAKQFDDLRRGERIEDVNLGAREKRRDHFERWIFRGGADEGDVTSLDVRKEGILLSFVEAMDFVDEDDGALAGVGFVFGGGHDFLDFLDAGEHCAEGDKFRSREARNQARESCFAAARRTPQQHRGDFVVFDLLAQRFAGSQKFFLPDEFIERARTHALGQRLVRGIFERGLGKFGKEAHEHCQFRTFAVRREMPLYLQTRFRMSRREDKIGGTTREDRDNKERRARRAVPLRGGVRFVEMPHDWIL